MGGLFKLLRFKYLDVVENEICPVYVCKYNGDVNINLNEVQNIKWVSWVEWLVLTEKSPETFSPCSIEETQLLLESNLFNSWFN